MGFLDELKSRNFSVYGQCKHFDIAQQAYFVHDSNACLVLIVLGGLNFVHNVIFSIVGWVIAFILLFVEIPLLTHCCPTSPRLMSGSVLFFILCKTTKHRENSDSSTTFFDFYISAPLPISLLLLWANRLPVQSKIRDHSLGFGRRWSRHDGLKQLNYETFSFFIKQKMMGEFKVG
ncbi:hypothetical protein BDF20DRAFT_833003 [Mycotypha africana]|uniref:uncharacterized protein n=1 Tax=Mycotypha africana TaxID=64632 RepID=UPI0023017895|nr:uncharacterized protein BDF20DRAFT_833003 [Mycotypha africana]KAI8988129.1 hypothetical protein BDF20DRAFT_833003 [Mycotypha africana]